MAYKFVADNCENCGEPLVADENTETVEAQDSSIHGCCPNCSVYSIMEEV